MKALFGLLLLALAAPAAAQTASGTFSATIPVTTTTTVNGTAACLSVVNWNGIDLHIQSGNPG